MKSKAMVFASVAGLAFAGTALAHHSHAQYETEDRSVVLNGTVMEFEWRNPHSWVRLAVRNEATGQAKDWLLEARGTAALTRNGWTKESLKLGDSVTITVRPLRSGGAGGLVRQVTFPDGRTLDDGYGNR